MLEIKGDMFDHVGKADWLFILTNCMTDRNGNAIMGGGCALQAKLRWPGIEKVLGDSLRRDFYYPIKLIQDGKTEIWSFPTKFDVRQNSSVTLIEDCAKFVLRAAGSKSLDIVVPRPGCGLGGLSWEKDVRPILKDRWDDRFKVITNE